MEPSYYSLEILPTASRKLSRSPHGQMQFCSPDGMIVLPTSRWIRTPTWMRMRMRMMMMIPYILHTRQYVSSHIQTSTNQPTGVLNLTQVVLKFHLGLGPMDRSWSPTKTCLDSTTTPKSARAQKARCTLCRSSLTMVSGFLRIPCSRIEWEIQDPQMELLYHIRPYFVGIFSYISLIYAEDIQKRRVGRAPPCRSSRRHVQTSLPKASRAARVPEC